MGALALLLFGVAAGPAHAASGAVMLLIRQAERFLAQNQPGLAVDPVERALAADPSNPDVLAVAAKVAAAKGDKAGAAALIVRLRSAGGAADQVQGAEAAVNEATLDRRALEEARALARAGDADAASARYRALFPNGPTDAYALEYNQALAGSAANKAVGVEGLNKLAARPDAAPNAKLAAAQAQTYAPATRVAGIARLMALADQPGIGPAALKSWHDALGYFGTDPAVRPLLKAYLARDPGDASIRDRLAAMDTAVATIRPDPGEALRSQGYALMERNQFDAAAEQFDAAIAANARDGDALGGLGIVRLRQNRPADARPLLERAVAADPTRAAQWSKALAGAQYGEELAAGRAAARAGDTAGAATALTAAASRDVDDRADAETLLGEAALKAGDNPGAQAHFQVALAQRPGFPPAARGMAQATREPVAPVAAAVFRPRVPVAPEPGTPKPVISSTGTPRRAATEPAAPNSELRQEAALSADPAVAAALLRNAVATTPDDPWPRLDLARALRKQGRGTEGRALVEDLAARTGTPDANYAAALLAQEDNRNADADAFLARIEPGRRTPDMARLAARTRTARDIAEAAGGLGGDGPDSRNALLQVAARPDPSGNTAADVVRAFGAAHDDKGAALAARVGQAANRGGGAGARLAIAGALLGAGLEADASAIADGVQSAPSLTAAQRHDVASLRAGIAIRGSDRLNEAGQQAQAYEKLRPALVADPDGSDTQLALARLYNGAKRPLDAQRITDAVLRREPDNLDARSGAVDAAIGAGDLPRARQLVAESSGPASARILLLQARVARASGSDGRAQALLQQAATQRTAELADSGQGSGGPGSGGPGSSGPGSSGPGSSGAGGTVTAANPFGTSRLAAPGNPFAADDTSATDLALGQPSDPLQRDIANALTALHGDTASIASAGAGLRTRSGTNGLDKLTEFSVPVEASASAGSIGGRIVATASPVLIDSGRLGANDSAARLRFGSNAASRTLRDPGDNSAAGASVGVSYLRGDNFRVDVGTSPLGFRTTNILGGVEFATALTPNLRLRVTGERRSVTDSVLSWSGLRDPGTGTTWGGVVRTGGRAQLEVPLGPGYGYAGGGYSTFTGTHTARNARIEAGAGVSYPVLKTSDGELTTGLDLVYFNYDNNQRGFTVGQGGYFSPQSFFVINVPVDYRGKVDKLSYRVGVTAGYDRFHENASPLYPHDPELQAQAIFNASQDINSPAFNIAQNKSGLVGGVRLNLDYAITPSVTLMTGLSYDKAADYQETKVAVRLQDRF